MGVSMKYQGCFMQVSWIGSFKVVSRKFQGWFEGAQFTIILTVAQLPHSAPSLATGDGQMRLR